MNHSNSFHNVVQQIALDRDLDFDVHVSTFDPGGKGLEIDACRG